jgi:formylmethanofuran dehydrogenase subunit B
MAEWHAATCAGCGCGCDDIEVAVAAGALERVTHTCAIGDEWFAERAVDAATVARIDGREADFAEAVEASAAILGEARRPLVCGLGQTDCESQRAAVALAEAIGAVIDPAGPPVEGAGGAASQAVGLSTATFGELRDRAELVVVWRADPVISHPRLLPRLRLDRSGRAADRSLVVVDTQRTATAEEADEFIELPPGLDFETLWAMRALVREVPLDRDLAARLPLDALGQLADRFRACRYGAVLHGPAGYLNALALLALVRDLARITHVVALPLRHDGNARGAEDVLAWQTGYPAAVSFARGHPRARPGEFSAAGVLERGETDAALIVGFDALGHLPAPAADHLRRIPMIVVDPRATETAAAARVAFATAAGGVQREGTAHRMDGVPVTLRAPLASERVGDEEVLAAIAARITGEEGS